MYCCIVLSVLQAIVLCLQRVKDKLIADMYICLFEDLESKLNRPSPAQTRKPVARGLGFQVCDTDFPQVVPLVHILLPFEFDQFC